MTRETKIGLFVGMGVVILIGILVSDHLSVAQRQEQPRFEDAFNSGDGSPALASNTTPPEDHRTLAVPGRPTAQRNTAQPGEAVAFNHEPVTLRQHLDGARADEAMIREPQGPLPTSDNGPFTTVNDGAPSENEIKEFEDRLPLGQRATSPANPDAGKTIHVVKEGETLSQIARQYFNRAAEYHRIVEANRGAIPDVDRVAPGTRLVIPVAAAKPVEVKATPSVQPTPKPPVKPAAAYTDYKLRKGETLASVAKKFLGSEGKWKQIHDLNKDRVKDPNRIAPGTVLRVPKK